MSKRDSGCISLEYLLRGEWSGWMSMAMNTIFFLDFYKESVIACSSCTSNTYCMLSNCYVLEHLCSLL